MGMRPELGERGWGGQGRVRLRLLPCFNGALTAAPANGLTLTCRSRPGKRA